MTAARSDTGSLGRPLALKPETVQAIDGLVSRYPVKEAALIPALHRLQDEIGWLPAEAIDWIADRLELPRVRVYGVVSFYTMFRRQPAGRLRLEICTNLSCSLMGAEHIRDYLCRRLGIRPGETTADGRVTLSEVECLGSCGTAPMMLVNDVFHEDLNPQKIDALIARIEAGTRKGGGDV